MTASDSLAADVRLLLDRASIAEVVGRTCWSLDAEDWARYATCYVADATIDYPTHGAPMSVAGCIDRFKQTVQSFSSMQHYLGNQIIEITNNTAHCRTYVFASHTGVPDQVDLRFLAGGIYTDELRRDKSGWLITRRRADVRWVNGSPDGFAATCSA
jgi:hypothetical protein